MRIYSGSGIINSEPIAAAIGFFDGVHPGHQHLINQVKTVALQHKIHSAVITFREHPRKVVRTDYTPNLLTTLEERIELFRSSGVDICIILDFNKEMSLLSAKEFIENILHRQLSVSKLIIGYDHRFGKDRTEGYTEYAAYAKQVNMEAIEAKVFRVDDITISSSVVRRLLLEGDVAKVIQFLKRPYSITGTVIQGRKIGRTIGYPTANIRLDNEEKMIPKNGVYAVEVCFKKNQLSGMLNIGTNPTVSNSTEKHIEVNIFNFDQQIYGEKLTIIFIKRIRDERKMNGLEDLKAQLAQDSISARQILKHQV